MLLDPQFLPDPVGQPVRLPDSIGLHHFELVGTFGAPGSRYALVRTPQGELRHITVRDRLAHGHVLSIDEDEIVLTRGPFREALRRKSRR